VAKSLQTWAKGKFTVVNDMVSYDGAPIPVELNKRILDMASKGDDPTAVLNFWEKLQKNPSFRSVKQLWSFLAHQGIPLTTDGCFLAYKGVRSDYKDQYSGIHDNSPGAVHEMPRNKISDDPNHACHEGFHVGALEYARGFSQRVVVCKVDPEHVVCVPYDHSAQKMRVCKYVVIGNYGSQLPDTVFVEDDITQDETTESTESDSETDLENETYDTELIDEDEDRDDDPTNFEEDEEDEEDEDEEEEPVRVPPQTVLKVPYRFRQIHDKDYVSLLKEPIEDLRRYATHALKIVGASKIPGGKVALLSRIEEVRSHDQKK
jgi:hypothetical protein